MARPHREVQVERNQRYWSLAELPARSQHRLTGHVSEPPWKHVPGWVPESFWLLEGLILTILVSWAVSQNKIARSKWLWAQLPFCMIHRGLLPVCFFSASDNTSLITNVNLALYNSTSVLTPLLPSWGHKPHCPTCMPGKKTMSTCYLVGTILNSSRILTPVFLTTLCGTSNFFLKMRKHGYIDTRNKLPRCKNQGPIMAKL